MTTNASTSPQPSGAALGFVVHTAVRAALFHAAFVAGVTVVKSATNAVFLSRANATQLPWLYLLVAIGVSLATAGVAVLQRRRAPARVHNMVLFASALMIIAATAAVATGIPLATGVLYVLGEVTATIGSVLFWSRVMDGFTARDQKRVVGWVGAGGMLGAAVGGSVVTLAVSRTGVLPLLVGAVLLWLPSLWLLRGLRHRRAHQDTKPTNSRSPAITYLLGNAYPRVVASLVVLFAALGACTDFVFRRAAAASQTEEQMASLFGLLNAIVGICVVVFQLGVTTRLLQRLGVFAFAAIVPVVLLILAVTSIVMPDSVLLLQVLLAMKGVEMAGAYSLHPAAVALLYNPMPASLRAQTRSLIDGAIKKVGAALAGLALVFLASWMSPGVDAVAVAVVATTSLLVLPLLRYFYIQALAQRLQKQNTTAEPIRINPDDRDTRAALEQALGSTHAEDALLALEMMPVLRREALRQALHHPDERVRTQALQRIPEALDDGLAHAAQTAATWLFDDEPGVACAAIEVMLKASPPHVSAFQRIEQLVASLSTTSPAWRRETARMLGRLAMPRYNGALVSLLDDEDPSVRALACDAAAKEDDPALIPALISHLSDRAVRPRVAQALVQFGVRAVPALRAVLNDTTAPVGVRAHVPRLLERIGGAEAAEALLFSNPRDDAFLQVRIGTALRVVVQKAGTTVDKKRTDEAIGRRLVAMNAYDEALADLNTLRKQDPNSHDRARLLRRIVDDRRRQNLTIAMDLLALHRGSKRVMPALNGLLGDDPHARADSIELIDVALAGDHLRQDFLGLLERPRRERAPTAAMTRMFALCSSKDPVLRGVAQHTIRRLGVGLDEHHVDVTGTAALGPGAFELEGSDMADPMLERLFLLEHVDLFAGLAADDVLAIAAIATEQAVPAGDWLYREGDAGTSLFVLVEGRIELTRAGKSIMVLQAGESAGQVSFLDRGARPVSARVAAEAPARVLRVERDDFMDLMADRSSLMHAFFGVLAQRLRSLIEAHGGS
jgi:hypothetical protein